MDIEWGLLVLRLVVGTVLAAQGARKLFGWFGGDGFGATTAWLASMGLRPAPFWAAMAGLSEFGGGILLMLGLLSPLGALGIIASMLMAIIKVHWSNGLWNDNGGMELPLTNLAAALALALSGPGAYSLDAALGIVLPQPATLLTGLAAVIAGLTIALLGESRHSAAGEETAQRAV